MSDQAGVIVRDYASLVEALCAQKNALGLSDALCDDLLGYARGTTTKYLGPMRDKKIGAKTLGDFLSLLAIELVPQVNKAAAKLMESRWEGRDVGKAVVGPTHYVSKKTIARMTPLVFSEMGKKSAQMLTVSMRRKRARKAARKRWAKPATPSECCA